MIVGAVGTGKTSACMYPYAEQLLRWRAGDPERKIGGLVLEVKGDFCQQVRGMLARAGRASDYAEIRLGGDICYNPLHNDLDPYAVAFAIATLVNNLFGKSKEPFWQQAYTDLLKFVILLRRLVDGYTTLCGGVPLHPRRLEDRERHQHAESDARRAAGSHRRSDRELRAAGGRHPVDELVPGRPRTHGASVQRRAGVAPARAPGVRSRYGGERHGLDRAETSARRRRSMVHPRLAEARPAAPLVDHGRASSSSCRSSTRTRRFTARSVRREARTRDPRNPATRDRLPRSRNCSNPATSWRSTFPSA